MIALPNDWHACQVAGTPTGVACRLIDEHWPGSCSGDGQGNASGIDGHLHHAHADHVAECTVAVDAANPAVCSPGHAGGEHVEAHAHRLGCGHEAVPHGDHVDYLVGAHLHHPHGEHCDDHGRLQPV